MALLTFRELTLSFGHVDIFRGLYGTVHRNSAVGLVGPNGIGKTTLLRLLSGKSEPSEGVVETTKGIRLGYLEQEAVQAFADDANTVFEEMLTVFDDLRQQEARLEELAHAMQEGDETLLEQYGTLQHQFEEAGGYDYRVNISKVLTGLGFRPEMFDLPLAHCSGGQKTRALLARLLLEQPDLLILDEPTNHLDTQAIEWLEEMLDSWKGSLLVVSHDRYFLDKVVKHIWEMSRHGLESFRGNYSAYLHQRDERWERKKVEFEQVQTMFLKELDYVKKNIVRDSTTAQAKGRMKRLVRQVKAVEISGAGVLQQSWLDFSNATGGVSGEKWNVKELERHIRALEAPHPDNIQIHMSFRCTSHMALKVLRGKDAHIGYPGTELFTADELEVEMGQRVAVIGPNGCGKSTFLRTVVGELELLSGHLELGANQKIAYFAQAHDSLNPENSVMDELISHKPAMLPPEARKYLARFLFRGEDVFKQVRALSGGERGRLTLAVMALHEVNLLVLDEPTNHLDIAAREVLEAALLTFPGTVLVVTHDRYFINCLATQVWNIEERRLVIHNGDYQSYLGKLERDRLETAGLKREKTKKKAVNRSKPTIDYAAELPKVEADIHRVEEELEILSADMANAAVCDDPAEVAALNLAYEEKQNRLETLMQTWEEYSLLLPTEGA